MRIALLELRRRPGRFVAAVVILFLISTLLVFLGGLSDGLNANNDGIVRSQRADLVVFSDTADRSVPQSQVDAPARARIDAVPGVQATGGLSFLQVGLRLPDKGPRDLVDAVIAGYELAFASVPADPGEGRAWADTALRTRGVKLGTTVLVGPARTPVTIAGFVADTGFQSQGALWVSMAQFEQIVADNKPDESRPAGAAQVVLVQTDDDPVAIAAAIDAATGSTATLTREAAADAVEDIGGDTFTTIIGMTVAVAVAVVALFFALLTTERIGLYGVLKAIGARNRTIFGGVVAQSVALAAIAAVLSIALAWVFDALTPPGSIPFQLSVPRVITSIVLVLVAAILGAAFSLRRLLRIDPASAIGSGS
jgi:putative ABC transport system permease protein